MTVKRNLLSYSPKKAPVSLNCALLIYMSFTRNARDKFQATIEAVQDKGAYMCAILMILKRNLEKAGLRQK